MSMSERVLNGMEVAGNPATSQVYKATHKEDGNRLSYMERSFISFSFGGKWVEDFNLLVSIDGDRISRNLYAEFSDNETESDILDERFFWSSHFNGNSLSLTLSTDGITEVQFGEIQSWLRPGKIQELILSEHPNRAIQARVAPTPQYNLLPFEEKTEMKIGKLIYETSTTIYRGDMTVEFIMEEPYWYAKSNILCYKEDSDPEDYDKWLSAQGVPVYVYNDPDAIKVVLEDCVPLNSMLKYANLLTGSNLIINSMTLPNSQVGEAITNVGRVGPLLTTFNGLNLPSGAESAGYFYYGGNAPCKPILKFQITPLIRTSVTYEYVTTMLTQTKVDTTGTHIIELGVFRQDGFSTWDEAETAVMQLLNELGGSGGIMIIPHTTLYYITSPKSALGLETPWGGKNDYNTITIESENKKEFKFTTPSIWTGYNQAIKVITESVGISFVELRQKIRSNVHHYAPRAWANAIINQVEQGENTNLIIEQSDVENLLDKMKDFLFDGNSHISPASFSFNSKTGEALGTFTYRSPSNNKNGYEMKTVTENVGDMVKSDYLIIEDKNYPSPEGYIEKWTEDNTQYSHRIYHDVENELTNVLLEYKYMYY